MVTIFTAVNLSILRKSLQVSIVSIRGTEGEHFDIERDENIMLGRGKRIY